jgi:hypothetical protein
MSVFQAKQQWWTMSSKDLKTRFGRRASFMPWTRGLPRDRRQLCGVRSSSYSGQRTACASLRPT